MHKTLSRFSVNHPKRMLLTSILLALAATSGLPRLVMDLDVRSNFAENNVHRVAFENLEASYGRVDNAIMVVASDEGHFSGRALHRLELLTEAAWQTPYSTRVESLINFQHSRVADDELMVGPLVEGAMSLTAAQVAEIREVVLSEPSVVDRLITRDTRLAAVHISLSYGQNQPQGETEVTQFLQGLAAEFEADNPDTNVYLTGLTINNRAAYDVATRDLNTIVPAMYLLFFIILSVLLRSVAAIAGVMIVTLMTVLSALGIAGWLGLNLYQFSVSSVTIIITLSIAYCVHLLISFLQHYASTGDRRQAARASLQLNQRAIVITSLTTVVGFLSLNFSPLPPTRSLGNLVAIGVCFAIIYATTFLPAFLVLVRSKPGPSTTFLERYMDGLSTVVIEHPKALFGGCLAVILGLLYFVPQNVINDRFVEFIDESHSFRQDNDVIDPHLGGLYTIEMSIKAGEPGGISSPEYLFALDQFTQWLRKQPEIKSVQSYADVVKRLNRNMHGDEPSYYSVPIDQALAAQYLLLYEMSLPFGLDLSRQINMDRSASKLLVTFPSASSQQVLALQGRIIDWQREHLPPIMRDEGTSMVLMFTLIGKTAMFGSIYGALIALLLISGVLMVAFRSLKIGLISVIPNLLPAIVGFGIWGLLRGEMGMTLACVLAVTIGVVVDDTVHILNKYLIARRELQLSPEQAIKYSFATSGTAVLVTTVVLVSGFSFLASSDYLYNSDAGLLTAIIITAAFVLDLLFLPALLLLFDKAPIGRAASSASEASYLVHSLQRTMS